MELFNAAMNRNHIDAIGTPEGNNILNLGGGEKHFPWAHNLQSPEWDAEVDRIPFTSNTIDGIYAFHFFEHLTGDGVARTLHECERVLKIGGLLTIMVPHRLGGMAYQDLDHKSFFTESTWEMLLDNKYYETKISDSKLQIEFNIIMGDCEKNLALITQFTKVNNK